MTIKNLGLPQVLDLEHQHVLQEDFLQMSLKQLDF